MQLEVRKKDIEIMFGDLIITKKGKYLMIIYEGVDYGSGDKGSTFLIINLKDNTVEKRVGIDECFKSLSHCMKHTIEKLLHDEIEEVIPSEKLSLIRI